MQRIPLLPRPCSFPRFSGVRHLLAARANARPNARGIPGAQLRCERPAVAGSRTADMPDLRPARSAPRSSLRRPWSGLTGPKLPSPPSAAVPTRCGTDWMLCRSSLRLKRRWPIRPDARHRWAGQRRAIAGGGPPGAPKVCWHGSGRHGGASDTAWQLKSERRGSRRFRRSWRHSGVSALGGRSFAQSADKAGTFSPTPGLPREPGAMTSVTEYEAISTTHACWP